MVRPEITGSLEHDSSSAPASATPAPKTHAVRRWVSFGFGAEAAGASQGGRGEQGGFEENGRYRLEAIQVVRGTAPAGMAPGLFVTRREHEGIRPPAGAAGVTLSGVAEMSRSTPEAAEAHLLRVWAGSPWRVGLVLAFSHAPAFWALPAEQRGATYLGLHEAPREPRARILSTVLRRLYRARNSSGPSSDWDYLAFFEMQPRDVAHVRELLSELRDRRSNALFNHVNREVELWMTRQPGTRS
jgi:hypothetical protein